MSEPRQLPTVYVHIGTPKSGTTYLQSRMDANRERAAEQGLLWPGPGWGKHVEAVRDLRQLRPRQQLDPDGAWLRLVRSVHAWRGHGALISMEWLAGCTDVQVEAAVRSLQPARVEIIVTARDLLRMFVAQWQEMTKNFRPWTWPQFVDEMMDDIYDEKRAPAAFRFWTQQNIPVILQRWGQYVPRDHIHIVTVPPRGSDPEVLWRRFISVIGIDGAGFQQPAWTNESIGVVSASLMHRINVTAINSGVGRQEYQRVLHRRFANDILGPLREREASITVPPETDAWIRTRSARLVAEIGQLQVRVVGDIDDLTPGSPLEGRLPNDVTDSELLDTAVDALVQFAMAENARTKQLHEEIRVLRQQIGDSSRARRRKATAADPGADGLSYAGLAPVSPAPGLRTAGLEEDGVTARDVARRVKGVALRARARLTRQVRR